MSKIAEVKELNEIVTQIGTFDNDINKIIESVKNFSDEQLQLIINASNLDDALVNQIKTLRENKAATVGTMHL